MQGRVLIVAGSDSGGCAGIQADLKTVTALGGYGATAITALTAQNTLAVSAIHAAPPEFVAEQMHMVLSDIGADAIKTGMLHSAATIRAVIGIIEAEAAGIPLVVDPVMLAQSGASLLEPDGVEAVKERLLPLATLVTPNVPEAEALTGIAIAGVDDMTRAAEALRDLGARAALVKGGHLSDETVTDVLLTERGVTLLENPRIETRHIHGTGCTLASATATGLAQGLALEHAVRRARKYLQQALATAPGYGAGNGPLNHGVTVRPLDD